MRRTSLPAISVQRPILCQGSVAAGVGGSGVGGPTTLDSALISEAHGIVMDMLNDPYLPSTVLGGLTAINVLLSPAPTVGGRGSPSQRGGPRATAHVNLQQDAGSGSDSEENPYTGETPSAVQKRLCRKGAVPAHLLRRMSTSTWTTTTSATGMPTLEAQPSRRRHIPSFKGVGQESSPCPSPPYPRLDNHEDFRSQSSPLNRASPLPNIPSRFYNKPAIGYSHSPPRIETTKATELAVDAFRAKINQADRQSRLSALKSQLQKSEFDQHHCSGCRCEKGSTSSSSGIGTSGSARAASSRVSPDDVKGVGDDSEPSDVDRRSPAPVENDRDSIPKSEPINCSRSDERGHHASRIRKRIHTRHTTSDYESSESPSSTDTGDDGARHRLKGRKDSEIPEEEEIYGTPNETFLTPTRIPEDTSTDTDEPLMEEEPVRDPRAHQTINDTENCNEDQTCTYNTEDGYSYNLKHLSEDPLLQRIAEWDYPIFELADLSGKQMLSKLCYQVFSEVGLFETFQIPMEQFFNYFHAVEMGYRDIPYHNQIHAADVLHAVYYFTSQPIPGFAPPPQSAFSGPENGSLSQLPCRSFSTTETYGTIGAHLPALELMAIYTAAAMHDYDHPGRTNAFLVATHAPQAVLYNDRSVLENYHSASAWSLFLSKPEFNFLVHLDKAEFKRFRYLIIEAILATDLKRHFEILAEFNAKSNEVGAPGLDWNSEADRLLAMEMSIKMADINGPCKEPQLHRDWTYRIAEEFYEQGDEEARLGLPISPYMDRCNPQLAKLQESFITHLVAPLCNAYGEAGLMPGQWLDDENSSLNSDDPNDEDSPVFNQEDEDGDTFSTGSVDSRDDINSNVKKIFCIHTHHIELNHIYWVNKIKEEQRQAEEADDNVLSPIDVNSIEKDVIDRPSTLDINPDQPMEAIEEERTPASVSSSAKSFSFEKEDAKL